VDAEPLAQVFAPSETTTKARVLSKPEPQYTEAARKYSVSGMVALKGVISTDGRITSIRILKRLPHGLTQACVAAAKQIRFTPAVKDGQTVSQFIQLEYNFNLY
jgi:protein TonB